MPIKDAAEQAKIEEALTKFKVFEEVKKCINPNPNDRLLEDISIHSPLKITRELLIDAGISEHWFIKSPHGNVLQKENFGLQNIE